jgi:hypothetical protein
MTDLAPSIDKGAVYAAARERICALVDDPAIDPQNVVPATPGWTVHDVVAHLSGIAADAVAGNMTGAPGDAWTAAQVARNRHRTIADMIVEWRVNGPVMESFLSLPDVGALATPAVIDVHTHEADLRHALGLPVVVPQPVLEWAVEELSVGFHAGVSAAGLLAVTLDADQLTWFRGRLGRRTADEVRALRWSERFASAPDAYLDVFFVFGRAVQPLGEFA